MSLGHYYFIPTVREGLAACIEAPATGQRVEIEARVIPRANGRDETPTDCDKKRVTLFGPGDILGFDASVVSRTDPRINTYDFEPNFMPFVEFSEPDFPWRFTPDVAAPDTGGKLTPWLTLIVLRETRQYGGELKEEEIEYASLGERLPADQQKNGKPIRWIKDVSVSALPDLEYAWIWAHVQLTREESSGPVALADLKKAISTDPEEAEGPVVARLICPRRLAPKTRYTAFIVPSFKIGCVASGLTTLAPDENALTLAWTKPGAGVNDKVDLPYYYKWEFTTSARGDFESLVRLLEQRELTGLGKRPMDCSSPPVPGDDPGNPIVLEMEGALMSENLKPGKWWSDSPNPARDTYQRALAELLNLPTTLLREGRATPPVTPPVYGRRHSERPTVNPETTRRWQDDVNLDPRQRAAAGLGALVVQKEQEPLMASVWDQLGDIDQANEILRRAQLGLQASKAVHKRLSTLSLCDFLWTAAPLFGRVRAKLAGSDAPKTVGSELNASPIPGAAFDQAFRRMLRQRGGLRKRQKSVPPPQAGQDLLSRLNRREIAAAGPPPKLVGMPSMCSVTEAAIARLEKGAESDRREAGIYRINGRVVDNRNRRGLGGLRVEAWDKDPIQTDMVGSAVTDRRGSFRIEFDDSYFKETIGKIIFDRSPDLFFKVLHGRQLYRVIEPSVLRNVKAGDIEVIVAVAPPVESEQEREFVVTGRVLDRTTREGVPWVRVEAWDRDPLINDLVGSTTTDEKGEFRIEFEQSFFKVWVFDRKPDLYFKVFRREKLLKSTAPSPLSDVEPGTLSVTIEIDPLPAPAPPPGPPSAADFCEVAITPEALDDATAGGQHEQAASAVRQALREWLALEDTPTLPPAIDLPAVHEAVKAALAPEVTIPARVLNRLKLGPGVHQKGALGRIESEVELTQPMYEALAAISQDLILPGVETVPQNTISIMTSNRRFIEAYMLGLNDSLASEALWRGAPVYLRTTFFRQFWDVRGLADPEGNPDRWRDITPIASWKAHSELGDHKPGADKDRDVARGLTNSGDSKRSSNGEETSEPGVLLIRGDLLKRYPNTLIYAVNAIDKDTPALAEHGAADEERLWPIFSGTLPPDLTFLGFPIAARQLCTGGSKGAGYFIVIEELLGEPRFGFDESDGESPASEDNNWWYNVSWGSFEPKVEQNSYIDGSAPADTDRLSPRWGESSATVANICLQRPVRICIHARKMLPKSACQPIA